MKEISSNITKSLLLIILLFCIAFESNAQKRFFFIYIAHEEDTPVQKLVQRLTSAYDNADNNEDPTIFYLANTTSPIIVRMNLENDNREDFSKIVSELQERNSHSVMPKVDLHQILSLLGENNFCNSAGDLLYANTHLTFYVGNRFWRTRYNEFLIASLFFTLDIPRFLQPGVPFRFNVFYPQEVPIKYEESKPFGEWNISNINKLVRILPY